MTARDPAFALRLASAVDGAVRENESLARSSTYRIGGPATVFHPAHADDIGVAVRVARDAEVPVFALGLGSNVLLPDAGLDALVIRLGKGLDTIRSEGERWWFGAGLPAPLAARKTAAAGWSGLHVMVGVPGTVGGGVFMNAGCHGGAWADVVRSVTVVDELGSDRILAAAEIPFSYRRSGLHDIIVEVETRLVPDDPAVLSERVTALFEWRQRGTPFNQPCCGSVFQNPEWDGAPPDGARTAGQLIEAAGLKGRRVGAVEVSPMHANYFVNLGGATAGDVERLIAVVRREVHARFGVTLVPEVKLIGPDGSYTSLLDGDDSSLPRPGA